MMLNSDTGEYKIFVIATPEKPFRALQSAVNINLFNADTGTTARDPSFFNDTANPAVHSEPTTFRVLTGCNSRLLMWKAGDRVAPGTSSLGNPDGVSFFRSSLFLSAPTFSAEDQIGTASVRVPVDEIATVELLPLEFLDPLIEDLMSLGLPRGIEDSLLAKLVEAEDALTDSNASNDVVAINKVQEFIVQVEVHRGKKIDEFDADSLIVGALMVECALTI